MGEQSRSRVGTSTVSDPCGDMMGKLEEVSTLALGLENSDELADFLNSLSMTKGSLASLHSAEVTRAGMKDDKENMVIGKDEEVTVENADNTETTEQDLSSVRAADRRWKK